MDLAFLLQRPRVCFTFVHAFCLFPIRSIPLYPSRSLSLPARSRLENNKSLPRSEEKKKKQEQQQQQVRIIQLESRGISNTQMKIDLVKRICVNNSTISGQ